MVKVAVLGCGLLGLKIAGEMALNGHRVKLYDSNVESLNAAYDRIEADKRILRDEGLLQSQNFIGQILCIADLEGTVSDAEFIFEAVPEDLKLKQDLFQKISGFCSPESIIATNTLRLDVSLIAENTTAKERTIGLRFLYPVYYIPEVEITPGKYTSPAAIDRVRLLLERMGKTLFFRSGGEPLILTEEQREQRKQVQLEQLQNSLTRLGHDPDHWLPTLSHRGITTQDSSDFGSQEKDCAICMDKPRDTLLCPCHHLITCDECAKSLLNRRDGCPICRKEITEVIHVYHS